MDLFDIIRICWIMAGYRQRTEDSAWCAGYDAGYDHGWRRVRHQGLGAP